MISNHLKQRGLALSEEKTLTTRYGNGPGEDIQARAHNGSKTDTGNGETTETGSSQMGKLH